MRLAVFNDRFSQVYGGQENVLLLAELCRDAGHEVTFLTIAEGRLTDEARMRGLRVRVEQAPQALLRLERTKINGKLRHLLSTAVQMLRFSVRIHKTLSALDVDIVVSSAVRPTLLLATTGLRRRPRIVLYAQNSVPMGLPASIAALASWRIALIGEGAATTFSTRIARLFGDRMRPLPSGRDFSRFDPATAHDHPADDLFHIVTVCSIHRRKGIDVLIEAIAAADLPACRLTVVGGTTGPDSESYLADLVELVELHGLDVDFVGWQDDVTPFLHCADLFALASFDEGLPGVLLEAIAAGLACVTTRAGSAGELVESCEAGLAVDIGDRDGLAAALGKLGSDKDLRNFYATKGPRNVRIQFGLDAYYEAFMAIASEADVGSS